MMMPTSDRLSALSAALQQRGVVDVKFYFERGSLSSLPSSEVAAKVADFMQAYVDGRGQTVASIGDA